MVGLSTRTVVLVFSGSAHRLLASPPGGPPFLVPFQSPRKVNTGRMLSRSSAVAMKLYVGNLSYNVTNTSLEELFAQFGSVRSAQVITDRDTGRSKGFGFVEMSDDNAAREAIAALHEKEYDGRNLTVNEARPREDRGGGGGGGSRGGGGGGYG